MYRGILNDAKRRSPVNMRSFLLGMPDQVLYAILCILPFDPLVDMSQTCSRLRALALVHRHLWQALPDVEGVSNLCSLDPFIERSGNLGLDLTVSEVQLCEVSTLCRWLKPRFHRIRRLHLLFEEDDPGSAALDILHGTFAAPAPLLEDLCLSSSDCYEPFLGSLWPDILGGVVAPKLRSVHLTAFRLDAPCAALQSVTTVVTSVGALAPKAYPAQNRRVHALFPLVEHLEFLGIEAWDENSSIDAEQVRPLSRIPVLDAPLDSLRLHWEREIESDDTRSAEWLERSMRHVRTVELETLQCAPSVPDTVLSSLFEQAHALHIDTRNELRATLRISLSGATTSRSALVDIAQAHTLLHNLLRHPDRLHLDTLILSTDALTFFMMRSVTPNAWATLLQLRTLDLELKWSSVSADGWFFAPNTLLLLDPLPSVATLNLGVSASELTTPRTIDCRCILRLLALVLPNATSVVVSLPEDLLSNYELLSGFQGFELRKSPLF